MRVLARSTKVFGPDSSREESSVVGQLFDLHDPFSRISAARIVTESLFACLRSECEVWQETHVEHNHCLSIDFRGSRCEGLEVPGPNLEEAL